MSKATANVSICICDIGIASQYHHPIGHRRRLCVTSARLETIWSDTALSTLRGGPRGTPRVTRGDARNPELTAGFQLVHQISLALKALAAARASELGSAYLR